MKISSATLVLNASIFALSGSSFAAPGDLDPGFGTGGFVQTDVGSAGASDVVIQPDGSIVVVGRTSTGEMVGEFAIVRYDGGGAPDASFGSGGVVTTAIGTSAAASAVALQTDGKIVVAGYTLTSGIRSFALARYDDAGVLDPTFGTGGIVTTTFGGDARIEDLVIQSDGRIVAVGYQGSSPFTVTLARYDDAGVLDPAFGTGGIVTTPVGTSSMATAATLLPGDAFAIAGESDQRFLIVRYSPNGVPDAGFGDGGIVVTAPTGDGSLSGIAVQSDGKLVVAGSIADGYWSVASARYLTDGTPDTAFGAEGTGRVELLHQLAVYATGTDVAVLADGRILLCGFATRLVGGPEQTSDSYLLYSFDPDGETGFAITDGFSSDENEIRSIALQSDGFAVVTGATGYTWMSSALEFVTARFDVSECGDALADGLEECDDGNATSGDGCDTNCTATGCGNGIVTAGESCEGTECCTPSCAFEAAGTACATDDELCTDDECDGAGQCQHLPNAEPCDDGSICTTDDACSDGICQGALVVQCPACQRCVPYSGLCEDGPRSDCRTPIEDGASRISMRTSSDPAARRLSWRWKEGEATSLADLEDPSASENYDLCLFASSYVPLWHATLQGGATCGTRPCWKASSRPGFQFFDRDRSSSGVQRFSILAGDDGESEIQLKAGRENLVDMSLITHTDWLIVQVERENGACWQATHAADGRWNNGKKFFRGQ
jgi:uncharacterized delta-60 repeat protein